MWGRQRHVEQLLLYWMSLNEEINMLNAVCEVCIVAWMGRHRLLQPARSGRSQSHVPGTLYPHQPSGTSEFRPSLYKSRWNCGSQLCSFARNFILNVSIYVESSAELFTIVFAQDSRQRRILRTFEITNITWTSLNTCRNFVEFYKHVCSQIIK
jgi:hypothetical protein